MKHILIELYCAAFPCPPLLCLYLLPSYLLSSFTVILISFDCSFCCYSFRQAFSPSKSPLYLLGNILSASGFSVLWMIFVHDREGARPQDHVSDCDMHALLIVWQQIIWILGHLARGSRNVALQLKGVLLLRALLIAGLQHKADLRVLLWQILLVSGWGSWAAWGSLNKWTERKAIRCRWKGGTRVLWVFWGASCFLDFLQDFFFLYAEYAKSLVFFGLWCFT